MDHTEILSIAEWLCQARLRVQAVGRCPWAHAIRSESEGYDVQEKLHEELALAGMGNLAGYKIGCTATVMQEYLGMPNPAYGGIMTANLHGDGATFTSNQFQKVAVECEIAVWIGKDLDLAMAPYDRNTVRKHVAACSVAMELVDNRYGDLATTPINLLIADDFFHASCVLGPRVEIWSTLDLAAAAGSLSVNGKVVGSGLGRDVMEHPLEAVVWLANRLAQRGRSLHRGQVVLTGAIVPPYWIESFPAKVSVEVEKLGRLGASVA